MRGSWAGKDPFMEKVLFALLIKEDARGKSEGRAQ